MFQKVHAFRKKYYTPDRMNLCIQSKQSLDELQELAFKYCREIRKSDKIEPRLEEIPEMGYKFAFKDDFYTKIYHMKPVANNKSAVISFILPSLLKNYKSQPLLFLQYLFEDEGERSLQAYLKKK